MLRPHYTEFEIQLSHRYRETRERLMGPLPTKPAPTVRLYLPTPPAPHEPEIIAPPPAPLAHPPWPMLNARIIKFIKREVVAEFRGGITVADLASASRFKEKIWPRHIAMYLARVFTDVSLPAIGRYFGHRDHTTVLNAIRKCKEALEAKVPMALTISALHDRISPQIILWKTEPYLWIEENPIW